VPSQTADDFPADMLFKKRERREDVLRSFTLPGGLRSGVEAALSQPGIELATGTAASSLARSGDGFEATLEDGRTVRAGTLALALPPGAAAALLEGVLPDVARRVAGLREVAVDSLGFAVRKERVDLPYATFLIPLRDEFHSVVTRDVVPDDDWRAFTLHFRPGLDPAARLARAAEVLGVRVDDMHARAERRATLPSPVLGHAQVIADIDRGLAGGRLALTGNWFGGLSIEDCVLRSRAEWQRVRGVQPA
jgi:UDP-galactopyranose mutase